MTRAISSRTVFQAILTALAVALMWTFVPVCQAYAAAPAKAKIASVTSDAPGQVTVVVKKAKGARGYQVWASTSKKFDKAANYEIASAKSKSQAVVLGGLKGGGLYYVRARACAGKKYGKWSAAKAVLVGGSAGSATSSDLEAARAEADRLGKEAQTARADAAKWKNEAEALDKISESDKASIAVLTRENEGLRTDLSKSQGEAEEAQATVRDLTARLDGLDQLTAQIASLNGQVADLGGQVDSLRAEADQLSADLAAEKTASQQLSADLAAERSQSAQLRQQADSLEAEVSELESQVESLRADLAQSVIDATAANARADELSASLEASGAEVERLQSEVGSLSAEAESLRAELAQANADLPTGIAYELDGGTMVGSPRTSVNKGEEAYQLPTPVKDGHVFGGWYTDPEFSAPVSSVAHAGAGVVTVYAKWSLSDICYVYVDAGKGPDDDRLYDLYVMERAMAPAVGATFGDGEAVYVEGEPDGSSYPAGSITLLTRIRFDKLTLPDMRKCTTINLSRADMSRVTSLSGMFYRCSKLESLDVSGWDTAKVTDMSSAFDGCSALKSLDLSSWDTAKLANASNMFYGCSSLTSLNLGNWQINRVSTMNEMLRGCNALKCLDISGWNFSKLGQLDYKFDSLSSIETIIANRISFTSHDAVVNVLRYLGNLKNIVGTQTWDVSPFEDLSGMFSGLRSLVSVDVSGWDTSNVTSMAGMFRNCSSLESLDLSSWDTSSVADMSDMFNNCSSLESLDLSSWDTRSLRTVERLISSCASLESLNISGWDMSKVTTLALGEYIGGSPTGLKSIDVTDVRLPQSCTEFFKDLSNLETVIGVEGWETSNVTDMSEMFMNCVSLITLDVSRWDTSSVTNMREMFSACSSITTLDVSGWNTSRVTDMTFMFGCESLVALDLTGWDTSQVTSMWGFLLGCESLNFMKTGASWHNPDSQSGESGVFPKIMFDENGEEHAKTSVIPDGAHTFTSTNPTLLSAGSQTI